MSEILQDIDRSSVDTKREKAFSFRATSLQNSLIFAVIIPLIIVVLLYSATSGIPLIDLVLVSLSIGAVLWIVRCSWNLVVLSRYANSHYRGINDDGRSIALTSDVVKKADKWVAFYDYGEADANNIYSSHEIQKSLLNKLDGESPFTVSMIFSKPKEDVDKLSLVQVLNKWQDKNHGSTNKVSIMFVSKKISKECEEHYKINDTGSAFITKHDLGASNREFKFFTPDAMRPVKKIDECLSFHNKAVKKQAA